MMDGVGWSEEKSVPDPVSAETGILDTPVDTPVDISIDMPSEIPTSTTGIPEDGFLSRRSLVTVGIGAAGLLAFGGAAKVWGGGATLLRPPGAQDTERLVARCIRCERCSAVCPLHAIRLAKIEDGLINARTPKMDFRKGYCDFCNGDPKCTQSCPTDCFGAFDPLNEKMGIAVVDTEQCLLYHASAKCSKRCLDACAYDALYLDEAGLLMVDGIQCNGCGACEFVCPSASYQIYRGSPNRGINIIPWEDGQS